MGLPDWSDRVSRLKPELLPDQVAADMRRQIRGGEMKDRIPSEMDLAEMYQVSRITIRRALARLSEEGLIVTVLGRGTFVRSQDG